MVDFSKFDWGNVSTSFKTQNTTELTDHNEYERLFPVEEGDIVVDIGASVGPFTYSILSKKPKHCWVVEPMPHQFQTLKNNLMGSPVSFIKAAITDLKKVEIKWDGNVCTPRAIPFNQFLEENEINKIDFLKVDCEGGEYNVFSQSNIPFLLTVPKIVAECHLWQDSLENFKFKLFRDNILPQFPNYKFYSIDGIDVTWDLHNQHFLDYYKEVLLYIDNR
jgi:FkbM family methyltransferase